MALSQEDLRKLQEGAEEELKGYEDLPDGDYYGIIKDAARGEKWEHDMVTLEIDITEGEYTGRKKWANYTLDHQNPKVSMIAIKTLDTLAKGFGVIEQGTQISDYELEDVVANFIDKEVYFNLKTTKSKTNGKEYQNISKITAC